MYFDSAEMYILSFQDNVDKINAIQAVQDALLASALKAAATGNVLEYTLNDGQTIIKTAYRSPQAVQEAWRAFEQVKQIYINNLNGRRVRLLDSKNFRPNGSFR